MENIIEFPDRSAIKKEACAWLAKLDADQPPSKEDIKALHEWMKRSPAHEEEIRQLAELWGETSILTELAVPLAKPKRISDKDCCNRVFSRLSLMGAVAAVLVFGVALVFNMLAKIENTRPDIYVYSTEVGEQKLTTLADGSTIMLNTNSRVEVDFNDHERKVHLLRGEAHFDVAENKQKPFVVYADKGLIRAVGTAFSVYLRNKDIEVTVTEGKVELASIAAVPESDAEGKAENSGHSEVVAELAVLDAGQHATFNQEIKSINFIKEEELARKLSWQEGMLVFSGKPLEQVVKEISRYTTLTIEILEPEVRNLKIGGHLKIGETEAMFEALEDSFGVKVSRVRDDLVRITSVQR